ncbi:MAG: vitamin K epoxide reductase family protein [Euryarchaeota archaeon]
MELFDSNTILAVMVIPMALGFLLISPMGESLSTSMSNKFPSLKTLRGRLLIGSLLIASSGFIIASMTLWISNTISEGAGFCAADSFFSCDDVIGNDDYNKVPILGLSWAWTGIMVYSFFLWVLMSVNKEPNAEWVGSNIKLGFMASTTGVLAIIWLMYAEYQMGKICPYCTAVHVGNILLIYGFWQMGKLYDSGEWHKQ